MLGNRHTFNELLDVEFLQSLYDNDTAYACEVFSTFLSGIENLLAEVQHAFEEKDIVIFKRVLHSIKPTFSYVGLTGITSSMEALENKCAQIINLSECEQEFAALMHNIHQKLPVVNNELSRLKSFTP
jgi:HPt (histidine-containing phosphotransfer) domain-containing protein